MDPTIRVFAHQRHARSPRGDVDDASDVDLLVRLSPWCTLLGRSVDVLTEGGLRQRLRERILRDAIPL